MDCFCGKTKSSQCEKGVIGVKAKVRLLKEEVKIIKYEREKESRAYERDMVVFAFKEAEWKQEKKRLKEEVKRLRIVVEEKEEKIRGMEDNYEIVKVGEKINEKDLEITRSMLIEQMEKERALRDEAVDKWKKLYLAIKTELDDLIQRTHRDGLQWRAEEEDMIDELKLEVKAKDKKIEELKARLTLVENEEYRKAREVDILRQSLRIISSRKGSSFPLTKPKLALVRQAEKIYH